MMKKITLLLFTFISVSIFGQDKLTSNVNQSYDGTKWNNSSRTTYTYDANNNLIKETYFSWNSTNSSWETNGKETYTYNSQNNIVTDTYENIDSATGNPVDGFRTNYTYNSNDQIIETINEERENGTWVNEFRSTFTYTNNKITGLLSEQWNGASWVLVTETTEQDASSRIFINYGSNNLVSEFRYEEWNGTSWVLDGRDTYTYNGNNKLIQSLTEDWNGSSYENEYKNEYTYDSNGNLILEKDFGTENGTFTSDYAESYTFDSSQLMSSIINPFKDRTGFAALTGQDNNFINKITGSSTGANDRTTYYYNGATASINDFNSFVFSVFPNPTSDFLIIDDANFSLKNIEIYNITGKKIKTATSKKIDLQNISNGMYILKVYTADGKVAAKRIVKK